MSEELSNAQECHGAPTATGVIYAPPTKDGASGAPGHLRAVLEKKGIQVSLTEEAHAALASALHAHRARSEQDDTTGPVIVLIVEPEQAPHAQDLAESVRTYAPRASVWQYQHAARPQLCGWRFPTEHAPISPPSAPTLRLAGFDEHDDASAEGPPLRDGQPKPTQSPAAHYVEPRPTLQESNPATDFSDRTDQQEDELVRAMHAGRLVSQEELGMLLGSGGDARSP